MTMPTTRVTLLTEGTYPHYHGGVSVWCDQLVRGMPDLEFQVLAVTGGDSEPVSWELPPQVTRVTAVPTWGRLPAGRAPRGRRLRRLLTEYEDFLGALLASSTGAGRPERGGAGGSHGGRRTGEGPYRERRSGEGPYADSPVADSPSVDDRFAAGLYALAAHARRGELSAALRSETAISTLSKLWNHHSVAASAARPTLHDALTATDLLEHTLRPLSAAPPPHGVVHAVSGGLAALPGLAAHHFEGLPLLLTEHGIYLRERYLGDRAAPNRWPVKALMLGFHRLLARETYAKAALVTPGSHYNRRWEEHGGTAPDRIRTVYNGVDPGAFPPAGPEPRTPTLSWAGRVDPIKDLETLIRAFALVRQELPEARLRLFGGTPKGGEAYRDRCQALAAGLGLGEAVSFEGRVDDIKDAYAAGNVVMLSSISEGFPFTLIEAMSCGRATVSTDVGGVSEAVGDAGLVVPPRNPAAMAGAALQLLRDQDRRSAMGAAARLRVIDQFTLRHTVDSFREIYRALAAPRPGGTGSDLGFGLDLGPSLAPDLELGLDLGPDLGFGPGPGFGPGLGPHSGLGHLPYGAADTVSPIRPARKQALS